MQKTQRLFLCFLCLALVSLACLTTVEPFVTYPADTPTVINTLVARVTVVSPSPQPSPDGRGGCAVISADEALHLRVGPDEHSRSLAFMASGEVLMLISASNADWWLIKRGNQVGYARSKYLEKSECGVGES